MKKSRTAVALSGGIDSGIAASTLKEQGFEVMGFFMRLNPDFKEAEEKARGIASVLNIPFFLFLI